MLTWCFWGSMSRWARSSSGLMGSWRRSLNSKSSLLVLKEYSMLKASRRRVNSSSTCQRESLTSIFSHKTELGNTEMRFQLTISPHNSERMVQAVIITRMTSLPIIHIVCLSKRRKRASSKKFTATSTHSNLDSAVPSKRLYRMSCMTLWNPNRSQRTTCTSQGLLIETEKFWKRMRSKGKSWTRNSCQQK